MSKKRFMILLLIFLNLSLVFTRDVVILNEVYNPNKIEIYNNKLYVAQETSFFIYSLKDLSFIKKFGKKGEGPGELLPNPFVFNDISNIGKQLFVYSARKMMFFTEAGEFIKESKKNSQQFKISPFGKNYVVKGMDHTNKKKLYTTIKIVGSDYKDIKELYKQFLGGRSGGVQNIPIFADSPQFTIYHNLLYIDYVFNIPLFLFVMS